MKRITLMLLGVFLLCASVCLPAEPSPYRPYEKNISQTKRELVEKIQLESIALVKQTEKDGFFPYCAGVWVDVNKIMTAFHCVKDEITDIFLYQIKSDAKNISRLSKLIKIDEANDLALLLVDPRTNPGHPVAIIATDSWDGEHVNIIGHTNGMRWTYIDGVISSTRIDEIKEETPTIVLQISSPVWFGNSGGGAFNDDGDLLGISSFISARGPLISFFIHHSSITRLLLK